MGSFCHHQRCARRRHRKLSYQEEKLKALLKSEGWAAPFGSSRRLKKVFRDVARFSKEDDLHAPVVCRNGVYTTERFRSVRYKIDTLTILPKGEATYQLMTREVFRSDYLDLHCHRHSAAMVVVKEIKVGSFSQLVGFADGPTEIPIEVFTPNNPIRFDILKPGVNLTIVIGNHGDEEVKVAGWLKGTVVDIGPATPGQIRAFKKRRKKENRRKDRTRRGMYRKLPWLTRHGKAVFYMDTDGHTFEVP